MDRIGLQCNDSLPKVLQIHILLSKHVSQIESILNIKSVFDQKFRTQHCSPVLAGPRSLTRRAVLEAFETAV